MADESGPKPPVVEMIPGVAGEVSAIASANAPFIYFDGAANFGFAHGVANITLEALRYTSVGNQLLRDRVVVAHLRMNAPALQSLKDAIAGIELIANPSPSPGEKPN
jgi:hypothetical protein